MSLQEELVSMIAAEEKRLGVGSEEFKNRHNEIMDRIEQLMAPDKNDKNETG